MLWLLAAWGLGSILAVLFGWYSLVGCIGAAVCQVCRKNSRWLVTLLVVGVLSANLRWNMHADWEKAICQEEITLKSVECQVVSVETVSGGQRLVLSSKAFQGKAQMYAPQGFESGQHLKMNLTLRPIENMGNPGEFDSANYYRVRGIYYDGEAEVLEVLSRGTPSILYVWRQKLTQRLYEVLPQPESGILTAVLLGEDQFLDKEIKTAFQNAGIAHILAISGLHVGMIYKIVEKLFRKILKGKKAVGCAVLFLWVYTGLTGAAISTLRAALFCTISGCQQLWKGKQEQLNSMTATAWLLLMIHPLYLLDMGFQLSFGSVAALALLQNVVKRWFWLPGPMRKVAAPALAITAGSTPISLFYFYTWCPYQILLNLVVVPMMGYLFVMGAVVLVLTYVWSDAAAFCAGSIFLMLRSLQWMSKTVLEWPGAQWVVGGSELGPLLLYYLGWLLLLWKQNHPAKSRSLNWACYGVWLLEIILVVSAQFVTQYTFLNVGQGDCCVIESQGKVYLVDAGPSYEKVIKPYLQYRGIRQIDGVWLSHGDWDHVQGAMALLEDREFWVACWYLPQGEIHENEHFHKIEAAGEKVVRVKAGDRLQAGHFTIECLAPVSDKSYSDGNNGSMVLKVWDGKTTLLFCGDADQKAESVFAQQAGECDILKVGHHGSYTSTSELLLMNVQPQVGIISCDRDNSYGHPHQETVQMLEQWGVEILVTDDVGAIGIRSGWLGYQIQCGK
ncbi:MAG: DNA internalization-related competence protein ComEC/Rec2 [Firmicutes bacterium]|nr:DNA internalization-related competence protein ComEC/Rec2 [Bacillota bacterium]